MIWVGHYSISVILESGVCVDGRTYDTLVWILEVQITVQRKRRGILKHVCSDWPILDHVGHCSFLIHAQRRETIEYPRINILTAIGNDTHNDLGSAQAAS